jgi:hypothetical protein
MEDLAGNDLGHRRIVSASSTAIGCEAQEKTALENVKLVVFPGEVKP